MNETGLEVVGRRRKNQPAPPHVIAEALLEPHRQGARPWLLLGPSEIEPAVLVDESPARLVLSSIWPSHPNDRIEFLLPRDRDGGGTDLEWLLWSESAIDDPTVRPRCRRIQELINRDLRLSFGQ